jgi:hypothetical protein
MGAPEDHNWVGPRSDGPHKTRLPSVATDANKNAFENIIFPDERQNVTLCTLAQDQIGAHSRASRARVPNGRPASKQHEVAISLQLQCVQSRHALQLHADLESVTALEGACAQRLRGELREEEEEEANQPTWQNRTRLGDFGSIGGQKTHGLLQGIYNV